MDILIPFLKHSNWLDLSIIVLVILSAVILIPVGIFAAIASRTRKPIYLFLIITLLPLLLAVLGGILRYANAERLLGRYPDLSAGSVVRIRQEIRQEVWITTLLGFAGTGIPGLIGITGLVLKKEREA
jgi:hypothetical protein